MDIELSVLRSTHKVEAASLEEAVSKYMRCLTAGSLSSVLRNDHAFVFARVRGDVAWTRYRVRGRVEFDVEAS